jgi:Tfp pilus assembly protein PilX
MWKLVLVRNLFAIASSEFRLVDKRVWSLSRDQRLFFRSAETAAKSGRFNLYRPDTAKLPADGA